MPVNPGGWLYLIRVGYSDEADEYVVQTLEADTAEEMDVTHNKSLALAVGQAAARIMEVHDEEVGDGPPA